MTIKERFERKINDLKNSMAAGLISKEEFDREYDKIANSINVGKSKWFTEAELAELDSQLNEVNSMFKDEEKESDEVDNVVNVENQAEDNKAKVSGKKIAAAVGATALTAAGIAAIASSCAKQDTNEEQNINDIDAVNNKLSTFVNDCLNNGIDLTTDEALMLMYASNLETEISVGDNMTLEQVVIAHYINLAEDLIANNEDYKGRLVSDVTSELMTTDYQSALAKTNDAFIKYGYIAPTSSLIANENDSKVLADFEESLREGIKNGGDFTKANDLVKSAFAENSTIYRGTKIIMAGQYSAINPYGQNASVKVSGMDQKAYDAVFRDCGGNVEEVGYEAYTTYMTEVRAYLNVSVEQQINKFNSAAAVNTNLEAMAIEKYNQINEYVNSKRVELVTPENLNKPKLDAIEKENVEANKNLNDRLNNGDKLVTDKNGNQSIITGGHVSDEEKEQIEKEDKEESEKDAVVDLEPGYTEDKNGNIIDEDGNNLGKPSVGEKPVPDAPVMTPDEVKDTEDKANDLLEENNGVIEEEFIPLNEEVVLNETTTETIDGKEVSSTSKTIDELNKLLDELNSATNNSTKEETTTNDFNPFEDEVTFTPVEGIDENGNLLPGYTINENGEIVKEAGKVK